MGTKIVNGDLFEYPCKVKVVTLNIRGVMGAGVALEYRNRFPESFLKYRRRCMKKQFTVNTLVVHQNGPEWWVLFPTKDDWKEPSRVDWIEANLEKLAKICTDYKVQRIAMPMLGCLNGKLNPEVVLPLIHRVFDNHATECVVVCR